MRRFVITNPNLSVGRSGDIVTASQLNMDDDKLDEFVDAGYAMELHQEPYDPSAHTVADVVAHMAANPEDVLYIISDEVAGKNRAGIVQYDLDG